MISNVRGSCLEGLREREESTLTTCLAFHDEITEERCFLDLKCIKEEQSALHLHRLVTKPCNKTEIYPGTAHVVPLQCVKGLQMCSNQYCSHCEMM